MSKLYNYRKTVKRQRKQLKAQRLIAGTWSQLNGSERRPATQPSHLQDAAVATGLTRKLFRWPSKITVNDLIKLDEHIVTQRHFGYSPGYLLEQVRPEVKQAFLVYTTLRADRDNIEYPLEFLAPKLKHKLPKTP